MRNADSVPSGFNSAQPWKSAANQIPQTLDISGLGIVLDLFRFQRLKCYIYGVHDKYPGSYGSRDFAGT